VQALRHGALKLGPQNYSLVGSQGVALVVYTLRRMGYPAMEAGEGLPFDVLAIHDGQTIRIQTKSTQSCTKDGRYSFIAARGRYATKNRHAAPLTTYTSADVDIIACVALPIDKVLFVPVTKVMTKKIVLLDSGFEAADAAKNSYKEALKELMLD